MSDRIAITTGYFLENDAALKNAALMFDHVAVFGLSALVAPARWRSASREWRARVDWLVENGILLDESVSFEGDRHPRVTVSYSDAVGRSTTKCWELDYDPHQGSPKNGERLDEWAEGLWRAAQHHPKEVSKYWAKSIPQYLAMSEGPLYTTCRQVAAAFESEGLCETVVVGQHNDGQPWPGGDAVAHVVLRQLPQPDAATPWEAVLDFRNERESRVKFARLRAWMNQVARSTSTQAELEDELELLVYEYEEHMHLHGIKTQRGIIETLVVTAAEILEGVAKVQLGKAAKAIFEIGKADIELLEAERSAPGREIAYILHARDQFAR